MNRAQRALDCVQSRPNDALRWSRQLLDDPSASPTERASASWALGRAYIELDRVDQACDVLIDGIRQAEAQSLHELAAEIRVSLAVGRLLTGDTPGAWEQLARAEPHMASAGAQGRLFQQRGMLHLHAGDLEAAMAAFDGAERQLLHDPDQLSRTRAVLNRGVVHVMLGHLSRGEADFLAGQGLADQLGQQMLGAGATHNLGFAAGRRGDTPAALRWFDEARDRYRELGSPPRVMVALEIDHCAVLLNGGLYREAEETARRALTLAARTGNRLAEAEARLLLARAHLADGSLAEGELEAGRAAAIFRESQRPPWVAQAEYLGLQAAAKASPPSPELLQRASALADELFTNGWRREGLEVRTFAGRTALALGRVDEARQLLGGVDEVARDGSSALRATALLAAAYLHLADGDRHGAKNAVSSGMAIIEEHRSSLGSTELRAHASINAAELAELGLALATEDGDPLEVLAWAERWHAGALQVAPSRPAPDSPLARALNELREVHVSVMTGTVDPFDDVDPDRRIAGLEQRVRHLSRAVAAAGPPGRLPGRGRNSPNPATAPDLAGLRRSLAGGVLVEYFTTDGQLHAVVVTGTELTVHSLGPLDDIGADVRKIGAALGRLAYGQGTATARAATRTALEGLAAGLDERLVAKLALPPGVDVVVVPTGPLQSLPWPVLPSLARRTLTVAPSGCLWARTRADGSAPDRREDDTVAPRRPLLVCGAGLPGGETELDQLQELHRDATVLSGADATVAAVTGAMGRADLVHLAAHGRFRADNPLFSSLGLHDGPLTVYDIEALERAPTTVILPACDAARSSVRHGDELLGTAAALLQVGVRTVIAPVTVVPDATIVPVLMLALHRLILAGATPAAALARARHELVRHHDEDEAATASSFVAIGTCA